MEKETLEEAAETELRKQNWDTTITLPFNGGFIEGFQQGAKWQAERMYSEEDMLEFAKWVFLEVGSNTGKDRTNKELFNEWFEQFKKKIKWKN